jgi:hypothetical protein
MFINCFVWSFVNISISIICNIYSISIYLKILSNIFIFCNCKCIDWIIILNITGPIYKMISSIRSLCNCYRISMIISSISRNRPISIYSNIYCISIYIIGLSNNQIWSYIWKIFIPSWKSISFSWWILRLSLCIINIYRFFF